MFGELSKKLAEVWKAMPEKDKLVSFFVIDIKKYVAMYPVKWNIIYFIYIIYIYVVLAVVVVQ